MDQFENEICEKCGCEIRNDFCQHCIHPNVSSAKDGAHYDFKKELKENLSNFRTRDGIKRDCNEWTIFFTIITVIIIAFLVWLLGALF